MKKAALYSALLHGLIFILLALGLPDFKKNRDDLWIPIPVEILEVGEITQSPAPMPEPTPEEKKPEPKKEPEKPKPEPKKEDAPTPKPAPEPELPPVPEPPVKETEPQLPPAPEPPVKEPEPKPVEKKPEPAQKKAPPKPKAKPKPPKKKEPQKKKIKKNKPADDFESVLKDLTDIKKEVEKKDAQDSSSTSKQSVGKLGPSVTVSELDALRRHLRPCWNLPAGAKDGRQLVVEVRLFMNPDGTVRDARLLSSSKSNQNPFYRTAAESALRAVKDARCQPFPLPKQKYDQWKVFVISFNPKDLL